MPPIHYSAGKDIFEASVYRDGDFQVRVFLLAFGLLISLFSWVMIAIRLQDYLPGANFIQEVGAVLLAVITAIITPFVILELLFRLFVSEPDEEMKRKIQKLREYEGRKES